MAVIFTRSIHVHVQYLSSVYMYMMYIDVLFRCDLFTHVHVINNLINVSPFSQCYQHYIYIVLQCLSKGGGDCLAVCLH